MLGIILRKEMYSSSDGLLFSLPCDDDDDDDDEEEGGDIVPAATVLLEKDASSLEVEVDGLHSNLAKFRSGSTRERNDLVVEIPVVDLPLLFIPLVEADGSGGGILSGMIVSL